MPFLLEGCRMPMWDREAETMSRDGLRSLQLSRLRETLSQAAEGVSFYRDRLPATVDA